MPIYEGNTIEEATQKGLQALGLTKEDVTIDVLDEGKRILGQEKTCPNFNGTND